MMKKVVAWLAILGLMLLSQAASAQTDMLVLYSSQEDYDTIRENLEFAITEQGLVINNVMHIADMLARTGKDLGHEPVYLQAESFAFCSASLSYAMMAADPRNITVCPYTLSVYVTVQEPQKVYVAYRKPVLLGNAEAIGTDIIDMLDTIARTAVAD